jgi:DNA-directed RNA polymerase specialized sigma24 family protein
MSALTAELQHEVADTVARAWIARGVETYPYEDLYQDAVEVCHRAAPRHRPGKGTLGAYLYGACVRALSDRITRAVQAVGTRSSDEVKHLRKLRTVRVVDGHLGQDPTDYDAIVYRTQVRQRLLSLSEGVPEGKLALAILLDMTSVSEEAGDDKGRAQRLYYCVRRMKKALREDDTLARMAKDGAKA